MKGIAYSFVFFCLTYSIVVGQSPVKNEIERLPRDVVKIQQIKNLGPVEIPGKGTFSDYNVTVTPMDDGRPDAFEKIPLPAAPHQSLPMEIVPLANGEQFNTAKDARNLPLSPNGRLLSPDGLEVDFVLPNNPNDPGICATPTPYIVDGANRVAANCPPTVPCDIAANRDANIPTPAQAIKYIQLNWVVVQNTSGGASSNIDQTRIDQLMAEVNADFNAFRIQFCSDPATFVTDDVFYNLNAGTEDAGLKTTYGTTPQNWVNVYVVGNISNPNAGGYARFPYDPFGGLNIRGGVVLARGNMFLGTHTLAHELGHTFGLFHTFHGVDEVAPCTNCYEGRDLAGGGSSGGDTEGDWCSDTNPHPTNANICGDNGTDGCPPNLAWLNSPVNNHMSYSFCTSQFTPQQGGRMHCMIDTYLQNWVNFGGGTCGALPPTADFTGTPTIWQAPAIVNFTDASVPANLINTWTWNFDVTGIGGVTPATFNGQTPPPVEYTICDTQYTVSLTVSNGNGSDTETKVDYITVNCPANECDTLYTQLVTPTFNPAVYFLGAGDFLTGIPAPTLSGGVLSPIGFYERYITPTPGVTTVGAVQIALDGYLDADSNTTMQVVIYNSDPAGTPVGPPVTFLAGINPGSDLGVANAAPTAFWIPLDKAVVDSASFLVALEVFPGNTTDELQLISSTDLEGQGAGLNFANTNGFGYVSYDVFIGLDFDLFMVPMLGPWQAEPYLTGVFTLPGCDTSLVLLTDTVLYQECMTSMTFNSFYAGVLTDTVATALDSVFILYLQPPPDTVILTTTNECGRSDTNGYIITYTFDTTPDPDFVINTPLPVCAGTPVSFTGSPAGGQTYTWDFGDGTVQGGPFPAANHTYTNPGLYYVQLTVTDPSGCSGDIIKLDVIEVIDCSVNAPIAGFDIDPDTVCLGDPVTFTDTSQAVPDPPTNWFWAFDDGTFSLSQNPTHSYSSAGTFNVMLVASNSGGNDTIFFPVEVLPLPCLLPTGISLQANPVGESVVLGWEVPADVSQSVYEVQRSLDGQVFQTLGTVAWDEANSPRVYGYVDREAVRNTDLFYRIREVSPNGEAFFSNTVTTRLDLESQNWVNAYPNPVSHGEVLLVDAFLQNADEVTLQLVDVLGRVVKDESMALPSGMARLELPTADLPSGSYILRMSADWGTAVVKVIVE